MNHRHTTAVRLALIALMALAGGPAAAVTIIVENIHGFVADSDSLLDGDSDPFVEIWIDGVLAGTTPRMPGYQQPELADGFLLAAIHAIRAQHAAGHHRIEGLGRGVTARRLWNCRASQRSSSPGSPRCHPPCPARSWGRGRSDLSPCPLLSAWNPAWSWRSRPAGVPPRPPTADEYGKCARHTTNHGPSRMTEWP